MPLRIDLTKITTSLSPHAQRASSPTIVRNHGLGFGLHSLPKTSRPRCCYMVELATTRAAYHCLVFDGSCTSHQVQWSRLAKPPSRTSSALSVNLNSHQSHLHWHRQRPVITIYHVISLVVRNDIAISRSGLSTDTISTPWHLTKWQSTQHNIAVYMHPQNTEDALPATANIM